MNLLKIEWLKLKGHRFFWIGLAVYFAIVIFMLSGLGEFNFSGQKETAEGEMNPFSISLGEAGLYKVPNIWHNLIWPASFLKYLLGFMMIFFVANEFQYRTLRQNIIDGLSVREFYFSKLCGLFIFLAASFAMLFSTILVLALIHNTELHQLFDKAEFLLGFLAELFLFLSFCMMLTLLFKRSAISIVAVLFYYVAEAIAGLNIGEPYNLYLPLYPGREVVLQPWTNLSPIASMIGLESNNTVATLPLLLSFAYGILYLCIGYFLIKSRDN